MSDDYKNPELAQSILGRARVVAIVGLSGNPERPSHEVAAFLQRHGYRIVPVNPSLDSVLGESSYPDLRAVPGGIDVVDIFRRSEDVGPIVDQAIEKGARAVWMQLGVVNQAAARKASQAGLDVIMDLCMKQEYEKAHG
jgi:predicted CoA-binding protein